MRGAKPKERILAGRREERKDWEELLRGWAGWGAGGRRVRDPSSNACLANTICIDAAVDGVSVSHLFAYICIKLIPSPIATEIVSDAENKSTK